MIRMLAAAARSPVFANLLMLLLIGAGIAATFSIRREMFPEFAFDRIVVTAVYPGAAPADIEDSITIRIEEAIRGERGIRKVESTSSEGLCTVTAEVDSRVADPRETLVDVRNQVSRITTFPAEIDEPQVQLILNFQAVMTLVLHGDVDEESLTVLGRELEQELLRLPEVHDVQTGGIRPYELAIHLREADLQRYGLSFAQVAAAVRGASLDRPLGKLRSGDEEQLLRVDEQRRLGRELLDLPVLVRPDGTRVLLEQVARVEDGFAEDGLSFLLDGRPALTLTVRRTSEQDTIEVATAVQEYLAAKQPHLPETLSLEIWKNNSLAVVERLSLLRDNGLLGLALVFAALVVFLGRRLSFWVALGLPVAFLTALVLLQLFGGSLNMISSFALIMILGILVDDSIVVAENIARHMREDGYTVDAAVAGLREVSWPVIASVTTTAVAFLPLMFIDGIMGKFIRVMPVAVIACLLASLVECLLILPAHLAHQRAPKGESPLRRLRRAIDARSDRFVERRYGPTVDWALRNRYLVVTLATAFLILVLASVAGGRPGFIFFPRLDAEFLEAQVTMPQGTPLRGTEAVLDRLEAAAKQLRSEFPPADDGSPIVKRILRQAGEGGAHLGKIILELPRSSQRSVQGITLIQRWQQLHGPVPEARAVSIQTQRHRPGGRPIDIRIASESERQGREAARRLREALETYPGVFNVGDNLEPGKRELRMNLAPAADALGLTVRDLAGQLYAGFRGEELYTLQRGRDEVEVRLRYAPGLRERRDQLEALRLRSPAGLVPLGWAARIERGRSLSRIERRDGRRVVGVTADVDDATTNANDVVRSLQRDLVPGLERELPGVEVIFGGAQEEQRETLVSLAVGFFLAMFGIYAILALLFDSYLQPLIVMMVIPLGFGGAILGHMVLLWPITIFSVFGMVGLTGIVVNDALVLIDFINRDRRRGATLLAAAAHAGRVRFRAVFLTTVTTVAGLLPILLERSLQAQFIIPMAISIAFGVLLATVLTLYVVPALYLILEDLRGLYLVPAEPTPAPALAGTPGS